MGVRRFGYGDFGVNLSESLPETLVKEIKISIISFWDYNSWTNC